MRLSLGMSWGGKGFGQKQADNSGPQKHSPGAQGSNKSHDCTNASPENSLEEKLKCRGKATESSSKRDRGKEKEEPCSEQGGLSALGSWPQSLFSSVTSHPNWVRHHGIRTASKMCAFVCSNDFLLATLTLRRDSFRRQAQPNSHAAQCQI